MSTPQVTIKGLDEALLAINDRVNKVHKGSMAGLLAAGLKVQRASQQRVPVKFGNLKGSAYTRKVLEGFNAVEVGYTAAYALYIHENMEQTLKGQPRPDGPGVYWGPNGQPKFLESALRDLENEIVATVAEYAKVTR